jgi:2-dehydropantoate 2-reductase
MTTYAVLGTGALGGLYGGLLARAGHEVHFHLRSDFDHVRTHGLRVDTPLGDFHLPYPQIYNDFADMPQVDVVIVAWKTAANGHLPQALAATCRPDTSVLVLQNGLGVEQAAIDVVGPEQVLGGCCFLCSNKLSPGYIKHLDYGRIAFGEANPQAYGQITPRMEQLAADFQKAGIDMQPAPQLPAVRWRKLAWNIPFNGLSVVLSADTGQIMHDPSASQLAEALMTEVQRSAAACGWAFDESHIQRMLSDTKKMVPYDSSMLLDYRARRPMEVEAIFGNPLRAAQQAGYSPAKLEMLYHQLRYLDAANLRRAV